MMNNFNFLPWVSFAFKLCFLSFPDQELNPPSPNFQFWICCVSRLISTLDFDSFELLLQFSNSFSQSCTLLPPTVFLCFADQNSNSICCLLVLSLASQCPCYSVWRAGQLRLCFIIYREDSLLFDSIEVVSICCCNLFEIARLIDFRIFAILVCLEFVDPTEFCL